MMRRGILTCSILALTTLVLTVLNLATGSVEIPLTDVASVLFGGEASKESWTYIITESRIPQTITALFAGASLATAGLLMQTTFNNPLAGPSVLGITNGASLGVAIAMMLFGGFFLYAIVGALVGSVAVLALLLMLASMLRNNVMLLITGMMMGFITSSIVSLLYFISSAEQIQGYVSWGMGSFSDVTRHTLPWFTALCVVGLAVATFQIKPLNSLLLGEEYAQNLGFNVRRTRVLALVSTGILTSIVTAFCGPIAFIGLAVPHIARLLTRSSNHQILLPANMLSGAVTALLCNILCTLPSVSVIPLNAVTPFLGAPVILYIIIRRNNA